ncbi:MAG: sulfatase [Moraxellaceae bacterium]|nr:sulfatase [Moraxellaceae bacterium]
MTHVVWITKTVLAWLVLPCIFILSYVYGLDQPASAIAPHLLTACWFALFMTSLNVLVVNAAGTKSPAFHLYIFLCTCLILPMCLYYVLVLFGIRTWANVITIELVQSYIIQAPQFSEALGIPLWPAIPLGLLLFALVYLTTLYLHRRAGADAFRVGVSKPLFISLLAIVVFFFSSQLPGAVPLRNMKVHEPLAMTLFSGRSHNNHYATQGVKTDPQWDVLEEAARADYVSADAAQPKKNIIIILPDALRQDHMSLYGYERDTTPWLRRMGEAGKLIKFDHAHSTCAETTCAHASMLGSRHIREFPQKIFSLQEVLKRNGYFTRMIISGDHVNFYNIREIYGELDDYYDGSMAPGYYINDDQLVLDKTSSLPEWNGQPTFIHYHLLSNHVLGKKFKTHQPWTPFKPYYGITRSAPRQDYTNFYDNGVLQTDAVIQQLLETLKAKGYLDNALVVITSDHGDGLGEHQLMNHTNSVYQEALHVPLVFIPYGYASSIRNDAQPLTSLIDIAPTILTETGIPIPATWKGSPLQKDINRRHLFFMMQPQEGLYDTQGEGRWKYWRNRITGEEFVFDLKADPGEKNNLVHSVPPAKKQEWRDIMLKLMKP